eukprot:m.43880 g.43880  ORF g.43880 m.43880 type:complete len:58 (-) comp10017_c0_seq2:589-762(-)
MWNMNYMLLYTRITSLASQSASVLRWSLFMTNILRLVNQLSLGGQWRTCRQTTYEQQ